MTLSPAPLLALALLLGLAPAHAPSEQERPAPPAAEAYPTPGAEADSVLAVVERLFDGMRARDGDLVASVFHEDARLVSTSLGADGAPQVSVQPIAGFVAAVGSGDEPWDEPLWGTEVRVDGPLANVWTFYRFYRGETFSHCGHNAIQLVRTDEGWRIIAIADTRRTEGCDPP